MEDYKFKNGDLVSFISSGIVGIGTIKGVAVNGVSLLGVNYIVEPNKKIEGWNYDCISCFEANLMKVVTD